jgi:hypothetical protein
MDKICRTHTEMNAYNIFVGKLERKRALGEM